MFAPASENPDKEFNLIHVYTIIPSGITYKEVYLEVKETMEQQYTGTLFLISLIQLIIDLTSEMEHYSMLKLLRGIRGCGGKL